MSVTEMEQGEDYEEDTTEADYEDEGDEDTSSKITTIAGMPIKIVIIGGAILIVVILIFVLMLFSGGDDDDIYVPETPVTQVDQTVQQQPTLVSTETVAWTDPTGKAVGTSQGIGDNVSVVADSVTTYTLSQYGTTQLTASNGQTYFAFFVADPPASAQQAATSTETTTASGEGPVTQEELRKLGYTGDEIEMAMSSGQNLEDLRNAAMALRDQEAIEAIDRMADHESDEFKYLLNYSIFHFPKTEYIPHSTDPSVNNISMPKGSYIVNADYEKLDTYGMQLYLKVKIANDTFVYMTVLPDRWETLPDTGNIVVSVSYENYGVEGSTQIWITDVKEVDITQLTVNPDDTTKSFEEMIGGN